MRDGMRGSVERSILVERNVIEALASDRSDQPFNMERIAKRGQPG